MELILIRHGETEWNNLGRVQGVSDIELNETGITQAKQLASSLCDKDISAVYSSDLKRAVTTASAVAQSHGLEVRVEPALREMDQGRFEGMFFMKIKENHQDLLDVWKNSPETVKLPGGECLGDVQIRAFEALKSIASNNIGGAVAVVSHHFVISSILCKVMGLPLTEFGGFKLKAASKSIVLYEDGIFTVGTVNDVSHLEG